MTIPQIYVTSEVPAAELAGATNVLVLGNALGTDIHLWERAMPALAAHYSVVRFDMPGHGKSPVPTDSYTLEEVADAVVKALTEMGVESFDYAGVSVSGAIALEIAHKYPERIKHSVVVCSGPYMGGPEGWTERIAQVAANGTASLVPALPARWFADDFIVKDPGAVKALLDMVATTDDSAYIKTCEALGTFDARPYLSGITVPVLVISGEIDPGSPPAAGAVIAESVPGAEQVVIAGASHQAVVEKPLEVAKAMTAFLGE
jgi:3-oxoadipate enol-lactonase